MRLEDLYECVSKMLDADAYVLARKVADAGQ